MRTADGELSVREAEVGGEVARRVEERPPGWLHAADHVTLLVHGFNNNQREACEGFQAFLANLAPGLGRVGRFFWPGDADFGVFQLLDFLSYPTEIAQARQAAARLAEHLLAAWRLNPTMRFSLVGHSLGCRLILEMLDRLAAQPAGFRPQVDLIMLMAAAVPVELVDDRGFLRRAAAGVEHRLVLYSTRDQVLEVAFPAGQALACAIGNERAIYLEAVGRFGHPEAFASELPMNRPRNGHGDYWGDKGAAAALGLRLGAAVPREVAERALPEHATAPAHETPARTPAARATSQACWSVCGACR